MHVCRPCDHMLHVIMQRLAIAELLDDKVAARRAYSNLGNAQVFLGKYSSAAQHYL